MAKLDKSTTLRDFIRTSAVKDGWCVILKNGEVIGSGHIAAQPPDSDCDTILISPKDFNRMKRIAKAKGHTGVEPTAEGSERRDN